MDEDGLTRQMLKSSFSEVAALFLPIDRWTRFLVGWPACRLGTRYQAFE
jgi:hypothetical protein